MRVKEGEGKEGRKPSLPSPPLPHRSFFCSHPIFRAGKILKIPFLSLPMLPNSTETLAIQAITSIESCMGCLMMNELFLLMKDPANVGKHWIRKITLLLAVAFSFSLFYSWLVK